MNDVIIVQRQTDSSNPESLDYTRIIRTIEIINM